MDSKGEQLRSLLEKMRESVEGRSKLEEFRDRVLTRMNRGRKRKFTQSPTRSHSEESFDMSLPSNINVSKDSFEMERMCSLNNSSFMDALPSMDVPLNPMFNTFNGLDNRAFGFQEQCYNDNNVPNSNAMLAKSLYRQRVEQLLSSGFQPSVEDLKCIKQQVMIHVMSNMNSCGPSNGMEMQSQNGEGYMSFIHQGGMGMRQLGPDFNPSCNSFGQTMTGNMQNWTGFGNQGQQQDMNSEFSNFTEFGDGCFVRTGRGGFLH